MTINSCRICNNKNLISLISLGEQTLTGVFPKSKNEKVTKGPLELVKCHSETDSNSVCNLVQLKHSYDSSEMYGMNYGYRSGLNASMVKHLHSIVAEIRSRNILKEGDLVIDIGSNDSTLLQGYPKKQNLKLVGVDPTGAKFKKYYPSHIELIPDFFGYDTVSPKVGAKKAKVITSIAMFYDLERPMDFIRGIEKMLDNEGIWIFEQSYLPTMLETTSYDTICHEHLEYYALFQIKWMLDRCGMRIIDAVTNDVNGGSFRITAAKSDSHYKASTTVAELQRSEEKMNLNSLSPYKDFSAKVQEHKKELITLVKQINSSGKKLFGYGASTKGNVLLQYCNFTEKEIPFIAEVNEDKFGAFTPETNIPIISEQQAREMKPDYLLVLPWHFRKGILEKEKEFLNSGGKFIFPLPVIEIVGL